MDIVQLVKSNRRPRKQKGQRIETPTAWMLRYYVDGRQKCITLAPKNDLYRSWADVEPLIERELGQLESQTKTVSGAIGLSEYVEKHYLPWVKGTDEKPNKAAVTANSYAKVWMRYWKPSIAPSLKLTDLRTADVTAILTHHAKNGLGARTLSHAKWFMSGVYEHAIASGIVPKNPVPDAKWLCRVDRPAKQMEYSLPEVLSMLSILGAKNLHAAAAVALCYFAALRPAEARGLKWEDYNGEELQIRRSVWRNHIGETKTEESAASVPVIEPLRVLLERSPRRRRSNEVRGLGTATPAKSCSGLVEALGPGGEMTHEEAKAWLKARNLFPPVTPVAEPGMWHLRTDAEDYMEFVHRRTGEVIVWEVRTAASKCISRPDPCDFCVRVRVEVAERPLGKR